MLDVVQLRALARPLSLRAVRRTAAARGAGARDGDRARCCCSTSRCPTSTPTCARRCASRSAACTTSSASPPSTSRTTSREAMVTSDRIAVMNRGRIEQIDDPVPLQPKPRTRFVAGFIGRTNFLRAQCADGVVLFDGFRAAARPVFRDRSWRASGLPRQVKHNILGAAAKRDPRRRRMARMTIPAVLPARWWSAPFWANSGIMSYSRGQRASPQGDHRPYRCFRGRRDGA